MDREERNWLFVLIAVFLVVNVITLSPLVPWQEWMFWSSPDPDQTVSVEFGDYRIRNPPGGIEVKTSEKGRLRRTFYEGTAFQPYTLVATFGGILIAVGFLVFLANVIGTLGLTNVLALFVPERWLGRRPPAPAQA